MISFDEWHKTHARTFSLVASDYDETLAPLAVGRMSERTLEAVERLRRLDIPFVVSTGRGRAAIHSILDAHGIDHHGIYISAYNGAEVVRAEDNAEILSRRLDPSLARNILSTAAAYDVVAVPYRADTAFVEYPEEYAERDEAWTHGMIVDKLDVDSFDEVPPSKILLVGKNDELRRISHALKSQHATATEIVFSTPELVEINASGVTKGWALRALATHLGIDPENTLAFGDNENDVALLAQAGLGVAVANAVPGAQAAADVCAPSCADDGFAYVIERLFS
ncbi:HAD family hydrolase [Arcanobacterium haemolyticum]|nr:HAD family hydrolase [Arcanobacterium haemolyticum]